MPVKPAIIINLVYDDAPAAIAFLCEAFGFARLRVFSSEDGVVVHHAQLVRDGCLIMLSSANPESLAQYRIATPKSTGGIVTAGLYVVLDDVDAHYATASRAGAACIDAPHDNDYGGRSYSVRDCEDNFWTFGSYDPLS